MKQKNKVFWLSNEESDSILEHSMIGERYITFFNNLNEIASIGLQGGYWDL